MNNNLFRKEGVPQPLKTHSCHSERSPAPSGAGRSEESNNCNKQENRDSSANASE